jgi:hypothetical protein
MISQYFTQLDSAAETHEHKAISKSRERYQFGTKSGHAGEA